MQNVLVEALNEFDLLPRMMIFFIDRDLLVSIGKEFIDSESIDKVYGKVIDKLTGFVFRMINTKKTDMYNKRPGSVSPSEPKVIWVKNDTEVQP